MASFTVKSLCKILRRPHIQYNPSFDGLIYRTILLPTASYTVQSCLPTASYTVQSLFEVAPGSCVAETPAGTAAEGQVSEEPGGVGGGRRGGEEGR